VQQECNRLAGRVRADIVSVVASWTGSRADALRRALRMTNESFAAHLGVAVRTVAYWRAQPEVIPRPSMQDILDTALATAPPSVQEQFRLVLAEPASPASHPPAWAAADDDLDRLTEWLGTSSTSDETIEQVEQTTAALAGLHTKLPARPLLRDVLRMHRQAQDMLHTGRPRLRQARELIRVDGLALAHASVLIGDLGRDRDATRYGRAAQLCLQEAGASEAPAWYALAKAARWQRDYATAADLAERGFEYGPVTPMSVQLASYEANAAALLGDDRRAREALSRSEQIAAALAHNTGADTSPWAFPAQRRAVFRLSVLLRTDDAAGAIEAAADADAGWAAGEQHIRGTWAQVRIGAAIAHLLRRDLDGATEELAPVLDMPPDFRIATVTGWLADLDAQLARGPHAGSPAAAVLRRQIRDFTAAALPSVTKETG
jgi:tetratricopeptide (TPR) repeat protein